MNENTRTESKKGYPVLCMLVITSLFFCGLALFNCFAVNAIERYNTKGNAARKAYTKAREEEADDYQTWIKQTKAYPNDDENITYYWHEVKNPLPKIVVKNGVRKENAEFIVDEALSRMPENIRNAVVKHYKIVFVKGAIVDYGKYQTVGENDAVHRTITIADTGAGTHAMVVVLCHEVGHMVFDQELETFVNAGYIYAKDLPFIVFHNADDRYSRIYDEYMAQSYAEYILYPDNLKEKAPEFYETMDEAVKDFDYKFYVW